MKKGSGIMLQRSARVLIESREQRLDVSDCEGEALMGDLCVRCVTGIKPFSQTRRPLVPRFIICRDDGHVVGIDAAIETDSAQLEQNPENVHVAVVESNFFVSIGARQAAADIAQVDHEDATLAAVVVNLVEHERQTTRFRPGAAAIEIADTTTRKRIDEAVIAE